MTYRVRNIVVAVVLAALAGTLTLVYVVNYKRHVQHGENKVNVLVAARDIPAGTTGSEVVEQHMLKTEAVPRRTLVPGWVGDSDQLHNQVATQQLYEGEQVTVPRVVLRNVLVLKAAPPMSEGAKLGPTQDTSTVQLRLTDAQSQKMMYVYDNPVADWYLQLRPPAKSSDSPNTWQDDRSMLSDGPGHKGP